MRFPEFSEDWEECKVGDYGKVITGCTPPTKDSANYEDGKYLWASPADLSDTKYISNTQTRLSALGFSKTRKLPKGSILATCIGSTIGKMGMASTEISTNQQINAIVVGSNSDNHFVYYALQSRFPKYLMSVAVQAVPIMSKSTFEHLVNYTTCIEEQHKIGSLLNLLDERISTQIGAIEKIESLISCLYDKLFQTETGETKPLKEICQIRKGEQVNSDQLSEKGEYYVMNGGITPSGYWNKFNTESRTISISEGGNSCGYVQYNKHRFWSGGHCYTLHPDNERVLTKYLFHYLKYRQQDIMALRIGSGLPNIQKKDLENYRILITPFTKQMHIVEILDGFYCKLNIEEQLLEQYKLQKQYLLSQMFV